MCDSNKLPFKWTHCHGFFQQNVVAFFGKSHCRLLEGIDKKRYQKMIYSIRNIRRY